MNGKNNFQCRTKGPNGLKTAVAAIGTILEEATFHADKEGVTFRGMDPSHVALLDVTLPANSFEEFQCGEDVKFGIRVDEFAKVLRRCPKGEPIELGITKENKLGLQSGNLSYELRMIEPSATDHPIPNIETSTRVIMNNPTLLVALEDIAVVSGYLTLTTKSGNFRMSGVGDVGTANLGLLCNVDGGDATGRYSLEYLTPVIKACGGHFPTARLMWADDKPLIVQMDHDLGESIKFYLAPRIES